jgi:hypothetical protein
VDKDSDLKNRIRVKMDEFDSIMIKESVEEVTSRRGESALKERRKHHNFGCIGCRNVFFSGGVPL